MPSPTIDRVYTWAEAIELSLLIDRLSSAIDRSDTRVPDSLGDRLFRSYLTLQCERRQDRISEESIVTAKNLLKEADGLCLKE